MCPWSGAAISPACTRRRWSARATWTGRCGGRASRLSSSSSMSSTAAGIHARSPVWPFKTTERSGSARSVSGWDPTSSHPLPTTGSTSRSTSTPPFWGGEAPSIRRPSGVPFGCKFCGVISVFGRREKVESPARTMDRLSYLVDRHGVDSVHFYDSNFFLGEDHAVEFCSRVTDLSISWWCESRIDAMLRFSDRTWRLIKESGLKMVFFGAESGSDEVLRKMDKRLTTEQTLEVAAKTREYGIIPEFSFVLGDPDEPEAEIENTLAFVRKLKTVNPSMELITYFYTPTPQRGSTYGDVDSPGRDAGDARGGGSSRSG